MYGAASAIGKSIGSQMGEVSTSSGVRPAEVQRANLQHAIDNAHRVGKRLDETGERLNIMAEFAESLATRLCGSYPTAGPDKDRNGGENARGGPISTVDAVNLSVDSLHPRIDGFENPLSRIARAFEMIDAANG